MIQLAGQQQDTYSRLKVFQSVGCHHAKQNISSPSEQNLVTFLAKVTFCKNGFLTRRHMFHKKWSYFAQF